MPYEPTEYDMEIQRKKYKERAVYALALVIRGIYYIIKLFIGVMWGAIKGVLQTFGIPVR